MNQPVHFPVTFPGQAQESTIHCRFLAFFGQFSFIRTPADRRGDKGFSNDQAK
jgi:hypothetical protein